MATVYRSLEETLKVLEELAENSHMESSKVLSYAKGILLKDGTMPKFESTSHPVIVIEGLDGSGKTFLTNCLRHKLNLKLIATPPKQPGFTEYRPVFDAMEEKVKRAYYSLGNYLAAREALDADCAVIMDRFWHSTAAYAFARSVVDGAEYPSSQELRWPEDLLRPDVVIFLTVTEEERRRRHTARAVFTNTEEEQMLANKKDFRNLVMQLYGEVKGVPMAFMDANCSKTVCEKRLTELITNYFPTLRPTKN